MDTLIFLSLGSVKLLQTFPLTTDNSNTDHQRFHLKDIEIHDNTTSHFDGLLHFRDLNSKKKN